MKKISCLFISFLFFVPASAHAHALLTASTPKDNAVLTELPREAVLRFDARIEKKVSRVVLVDEKGRRVPLPQGLGGPQDKLAVALPALTPGRYSLQYNILAADGHATPGLIRFTVTARKPESGK